MALAVLGKESLDELQVLVESLFSVVKNKHVPTPIWPESPYTTNELQIRINIVPVKEKRQLFIKFPIPYTVHLYKCAVSTKYDKLNLISCVSLIFNALRQLSAHELFVAFDWTRGFWESPVTAQVQRLGE
jgi:secreted Zn-dependent insulinase-like peptidase